MTSSVLVSVLLCLTFAQGQVTGYPKTESLDRVPQGLRDVATSYDEFDQFVAGPVRTKRATDENLQAYRDKLLEHLNKFRTENNLPEFVLDPVLESGSEAWALKEATEFIMENSCEECHDYAEILAKRRSSDPIPEGEEAGDWVYNGLFVDDEKRTYDVVLTNRDYHSVGFGISYSQNPEDFSYHSYAVLRFAFLPHH